MPNLSVKLDEATRQRLQAQAARQGVTPHSLMLKAITAELDRAEEQGAFVMRALQAREHVLAGGAVFDGPAFSNYLRARARGEKLPRPEARNIAEPSDPFA
jgi:predicted transcriptional regulator